MSVSKFGFGFLALLAFPMFSVAQDTLPVPVCGEGLSISVNINRESKSYGPYGMTATDAALANRWPAKYLVTGTANYCCVERI